MGSMANAACKHSRPDVACCKPILLATDDAHQGLSCSALLRSLAQAVPAQHARRAQQAQQAGHTAGWGQRLLPIVASLGDVGMGTAVPSSAFCSWLALSSSSICVQGRHARHVCKLEK